MIRKSLLSLAILLSACGGGGESYHKQTIAHFGDSVTYGTLGDGRLVPSPVEYMNSVSTACTHSDYSRPGLTSETAIKTWESTIANVPEETIVIRFGGADAILGGNLKNNVENMVDIVRKYNKKPVILSIIQGNTTNLNYQIKLFNDQLKEVSVSKGVSFIDVTLAGSPSYDVADSLHPNQDWANRISNLIVKELKCN